MANTRPEKLRGVLHLHSETGTEGGYWAFQDQRFITPNTTRFSCRKCGAYWDKKHLPSGPVVDDGKAGKTNSSGQPWCAPGTHDFALICPEDWSYEGLHILEDGDKLKIFDKADPSKVVWSGTIELRQHPLFTQDAFGLWIHADQKGIRRKKWATWFFQAYPAELRRYPRPGRTR